MKLLPLLKKLNPNCNISLMKRKYGHLTHLYSGPVKDCPFFFDDYNVIEADTNCNYEFVIQIAGYHRFESLSYCHDRRIPQINEELPFS